MRTSGTRSTLFLAVGALFILFGTVQFNDPDGWIWAIAYFVVAILSIVAIWSVSRFILAPLILGAILWMVVVFADIVRVSFDDEAVREGLGLLLVALWLTYLAIDSTRRRSDSDQRPVDDS